MKNNKTIQTQQTLLVALCLAAVAAIFASQWYFGEQIDLNGPQQLAAKPEGGYYLATSDALYLLNEQHQLRNQWTAAELGVTSIDAIAAGANSVLWLHGWREDGLRRCELGRKQFTCEAFGRDLRLPNNVSLADYPASQGVAIAYNQDHLLRITNDKGELQDTNFQHQLRYPNQIQIDGEALIVADTDQRSLMKLADGQPPQILLTTRSRPYRFVLNEAEAFTVETGITLNDGKLFRYNRANGASDEIATAAADIIDILPLAQQLIVISRRDWQWFSVDLTPSAPQLTAIESTLAQQFAEQHQINQQYRQYQRYVPFAAIAFILPLILLALRLEKQKQHADAAQLKQALQAEPAWLARYGDAPASHEPLELLPTTNWRSYAASTALGQVIGVIPLTVLVVMLLASNNKAFAERLVTEGIYAFEAWQWAGFACLLALCCWLGLRRYRSLMSSKLRVSGDGLYLKFGNHQALVPFEKIVMTDMWLFLPKQSLPLQLTNKKLSKYSVEDHRLWDTDALRSALIPHLDPEQFPASSPQIIKQLWQRRLISKQVIGAIGIFAFALVAIAVLVILPLVGKL